MVCLKLAKKSPTKNMKCQPLWYGHEMAGRHIMFTLSVCMCLTRIVSAPYLCPAAWDFKNLVAQMIILTGQRFDARILS